MFILLSLTATSRGIGGAVIACMPTEVEMFHNNALASFAIIEEEMQTALYFRDTDTVITVTGRVLDIIDKDPLSGALVELRDLIKEEVIDTFLTKSDGNFYFRLKPNQEYLISKIFEGQIEDSYILSTKNKTETNVIQITLLGKSSETEESLDSLQYWSPKALELDTMKVDSLDTVKADSLDIVIEKEKKTIDRKKESPTKSYYYPRDIVEYRIMLGSYKRVLSRNANMLRSLDSEYRIERCNGLWCYYVGGYYRDYYQALAHLSALKSRGYKNAVLKPYVNGQQVNLRAEQVHDRFKNRKQ